MVWPKYLCSWLLQTVKRLEHSQAQTLSALHGISYIFQYCTQALAIHFSVARRGQGYTVLLRAGDEANVILVQKFVQNSIAHSNNNPGMLYMYQTPHCSADIKSITLHSSLQFLGTLATFVAPFQHYGCTEGWILKLNFICMSLNSFTLIVKRSTNTR